MSRATSASLALVLSASVLACLVAYAEGQDRAPAAPPIGRPVSESELAAFFAIRPDGRGLPDGSGNVETGRAVFRDKCAMCHGEQLQGIKATGAPALVGGRDTLEAVPPKKTVESYWPYATTLFDYIKRAMPITQPGSLRNNEVYALCAFILAQARIVSDDAVMDKTSLARVKMPNRGGFVPFDNARIVGFH